MKRETINQAVSEAQEFIRRAKIALASDNGTAFITGDRATGALRRQSMELTRALAEMRRPG